MESNELAEGVKLVLAGPDPERPGWRYIWRDGRAYDQYWVRKGGWSQPISSGMCVTALCREILRLRGEEP